MRNCGTWQVRRRWCHGLGRYQLQLRLPLLVIHGNLSTRHYVDVILRPELNTLVRRQHIPMLFYQDNIRPHTARLTRDFYIKRASIFFLGFEITNHNLIEHLWDELGFRIRGRQHALQTVRQLVIALQQEWDNIPLRTVRCWCWSVRSRLPESSQHAGGHTQYWVAPDLVDP